MTNAQVIKQLDPEVMNYHLLKKQMDLSYSPEVKYEYLLKMFQSEIRIAELCLMLDFKELQNTSK
jgi:hypothetical protein